MKRGIKEDLLLESGLVAQRRQGSGVYDRFRNRVMIPIADERGRVVGFGGRVMDDSQPKYLNSPETVLFNKRKLLFGLDRAHRAIKQAGHVYVCLDVSEAVIDAAIAQGADMIISHHPLIFRAMKQLRTDLPLGRMDEIIYKLQGSNTANVAFLLLQMELKGLIEETATHSYVRAVKEDNL